MKLIPLVLILLVFKITTIKFVISEVFTALVDLEDLLVTEELLIDTLNNYIKAEENKIDLLKRYHEIYNKQHKKAKENVQTYVSNPINAYTLVKRLTADWKQVEALMTTDMSFGPIQNITHYKETMKFPTDEDLNGAAVALTRLQDTYRLDTSSLARGELNGVKYSTELNAADCFELGRQSYNNGDFYHAQLWMSEAESRLNREINKTVERSDILEYLAFSTFKQGDINLALDLTNKLLEIIPTHDRAIGNKYYYEEEIKKMHENKKGEIDETDPEVVVVQNDEDYHQELYEELCRGEVSLPIEISSKLKCTYLKNKPFLKIAPIKIEEALLEPEIYIFHDVMSDKEIKTIQKMAHPRFKRATVQNSETGELEIAQYRISKSAWLKDYEHKIIADVAQRVEDMTGLDMSVAEELQVVNYGIGGHYEPHFDFARRNEKAPVFQHFGHGNRIATVLFYMSDVPQGGATVFPSLNLSLWPKKGTAAFWFNLHHSGDGDVRTRHAACPVLAGSKWVSNKWIHEIGQEFRRPCLLERPPEELIV